MRGCTSFQLCKRARAKAVVPYINIPEEDGDQNKMYKMLCSIAPHSCIPRLARHAQLYSCTSLCEEVNMCLYCYLLEFQSCEVQVDLS